MPGDTDLSILSAKEAEAGGLQVQAYLRCLGILVSHCLEIKVKRPEAACGGTSL